MSDKDKAVYEAVLIDKITPAADQIVKALDKIQTALDRLGPSAGNLNKDLEGIAKSHEKLKPHVFPATPIRKGPAQQAKEAAKALAERNRQLAKSIQSVQRTSFVVGQALGNFAQALGRVTRQAGLASVALGTGLAAAMYAASRAGAEFVDSLQFLSQVFDDNAAGVAKMRDWIRKYTDTVNASEVQTIKFASRFKSFLGEGQTDSDAMVQTMIKMVNDLVATGGFSSAEEAAKLLQSFIADENLALARIGIKINAMDLDTLANQMFGADYKELDKATRMWLRYSMAVQEMQDKKIWGQAEKESQQFGSILRGVWADIADAVAFAGQKINETLLPMLKGLKGMTSVLKQAATIISGSLIKGLTILVTTLISGGVALVGIGTALVALGGVILVLTGLITALASALTFIVTIGAAPFLPLIIAIGAVVAAYSALAIALGSVFAFLTVANFPLTKALEQASMIADEVFQAFENGFQAMSAAAQLGKWDKFWEAFNMMAQIAWEEMKLGFFLAIGDMMEAAWKAGEKMAGYLNPMNWVKGFDEPDQGGWIAGIPDRVLKLQNALSKLRAELEAENQKERPDIGVGEAPAPEAQKDESVEGVLADYLGTTSSIAANNIGSFLPMSNILSEAKAAVEIQKRMLGELEELNDNGGLLFQ